MSREIFQDHRVTQQVVERNIEILPEASRRIPDHMKSAHPLVPWRSMAGIGNVLPHDYHDIRANIIWDIVVSELPLRNDMVYSRGASALGVALALGEVDPKLLSDSAVCRD